MPTISIILIIIASLSVLLVLFLGLFAMAKGGEFNKKYSNKLMQLRVILQAVALVLFAIALSMAN